MPPFLEVCPSQGPAAVPKKGKGIKLNKTGEEQGPKTCVCLSRGAWHQEGAGAGALAGRVGEGA